MNRQASTPRRVAAGVREGGQFAADVHAESSVRLSSSDPLSEQVELIGAAVRDGALAQGLVRDRARHERLTEWLDRARKQAANEPAGSARAEAFEQFAAGIEHAIIALWSNIAEIRDDYVVDRLLRDLSNRPLPAHVGASVRQHAMWEKRTSARSRAEYAAALQTVHGPMRRGMALAGLILSGLEQQWEIGDDLESCVFGPRAVEPA